VNELLAGKERITLITHPPFQTRIVTYDERLCSIIGTNKGHVQKWELTCTGLVDQCDDDRAV
jgi:hypothetical protein